MNDRESEDLQRAASEADPGEAAEQKAAQLRPELERYAQESEAKENDDLHSENAAPEQASEGVAEHERDMVQRGFEKEGPPE